MGAFGNMHGACRPAVLTAGGATLRFSGPDRLMKFLISSSYEFL